MAKKNIEIPKIKAILDKNYCLYNFLERMMPQYDSIEREIYGKGIGMNKITSFFNEWKKLNRTTITGEAIRRDWEKFNNSSFKKIWDENKERLEKHEKEINKILKNKKDDFLKHILTTLKKNRFDYDEIIILIVFPRMLSKNRIIHHGNWKIEKKKLYINFGPLFKEKNEILSIKDLYVIWHEIVHTFQINPEKRNLARELSAQVYEDILIDIKDVEKKKRINGFLKSYRFEIKEKTIKKILKLCIGWDWKKKNIFLLEEEILQKTL